MEWHIQSKTGMCKENCYEYIQRNEMVLPFFQILKSLTLLKVFRSTENGQQYYNVKRDFLKNSSCQNRNVRFDNIILIQVISC